MYGTLRKGDGKYRRRWKDELNELKGDFDIVQRIKSQQLRWLGHVVPMHESQVRTFAGNIKRRATWFYLVFPNGVKLRKEETNARYCWFSFNRVKDAYVIVVVVYANSPDIPVLTPNLDYLNCLI